MPTLFQLLQALVQRRFGMTKHEMTTLLGKSPRQVERYLQQLAAAGIPLKTDGPADAGLALRWSIDRTDFLGLPTEIPAVDFSLIELFLLITAIESADLPATSWIDAARLNLIRKLSAFQPLQGARKISMLHGRINAIGPRHVQRDSISEATLNRLLEGMTRSLAVRISYPWHKERKTARIIHPVSMVCIHGAYYCLVRVQPYVDLRLIKVSRITRATLLSAPFDPIEKRELKNHLNQSFGLWQEEPRLIKIRFSVKVAGIIQSMKIHPSQRFLKNSDGSVMMLLTVGGKEEILQWIMQWADQAELIAPEDWRPTLATKIGRMAAQYI